MKKHLHNCGDPSCPKFGKPTCLVCDDLGPPKGSKRTACSECGRLRATANPPDMGPGQPCSCGGKYAVSKDGGTVGHSEPPCNDYSRLRGGDFLKLQKLKRPN